MRMGKWMVSLGALLASVCSSTVLGQVDARLLRQPDVSSTHICFVYAGDIWVVEKQGGVARRLSSPRGEELLPRFSPDGDRIAFSANYDGNMDVYVVPSLGGQPERVTFHPGSDRLVDWTPGGDRLLFASSRESGFSRFNQFYSADVKGGLPTKLPVAYAEFGSLSPDGRQLAFTTKNREFRTWKRYRGGLAPDIWLMDLENKTARNLTDSPANDSMPMWHGRTLYFLSDRGKNQRSNIWSLDIDSGKIRQVTNFSDFDVSLPAIGPEDIVFQAGGLLYLLELENERVQEVDVRVVSDMATLLPHRKQVDGLIQSWSVSPTAQRALFEARGEIFSLPAEHGPVRRLTSSSGIAERFPSWSPDGKTIAFWSDRSGEYELHLLSAEGQGEERQVTHLGPGFRYHLFWSPDSEKLAFVDHSQTIWVYLIEGERLVRVDQGLFWLHGSLMGFRPSWSSDSRWLAYSRELETTNEAVFVFDSESETSHQVTSGYFSDTRPAFDPDGKYLYYLSNRNLEPIYSDLDATWVYPNSTRIIAVPLRADVLLPLAPRNDEEGGGKTDKEEETGEEKPGAEATAEEGGGDEQAEAGARDKEDREKTKVVDIELDGFEARAIVLPPEAGNYGWLGAVSGKILFHRAPRRGSSDRKSPVVLWDLKERKEETVLADADSVALSFDGKKLLARVGGKWSIVKVAPNQKSEKGLRTNEMESVIDPREEWKQIFTEVWRTYRDYFYDPHMHGLDWAEMREHYGSLLADAVTRWDVNFVIGELIGEINASHTYVGGGDTERGPSRRAGLLGIDWELGDGAFRIGRIVRGAPWDSEVRSPLAEPGVEVSEGDYILAVNGTPLDTTTEPYAAFDGLAGRTVSLTVNSTPSLEGARQVLVETLTSESRLRNLEWIEGNRRWVEEASGGKIGYIFVPNTGIEGQTELVRQFKSQMRLPGLIIDERFNGGGQLPDRFIELMDRRLVNRISFRYGAPSTHPAVTHYGPKAMLINGWAGSGGDAFPYFFKSLNVGPLVGERTWGGLIGPASGHSLIDGGFFTAPPGRIYGPDGKWFAEGHGVEPDIPVVDDPGELARGTDPQLKAAVDEVLRLIRANPPQLPEPPEFEKRVP